MTQAAKLNKAAATLGFNNVADAINAGFTADTLLGMLADTADAPTKATKPTLDWKPAVIAEVSSMTKNGKTTEFFGDIIGFTPDSTPNEGVLVGWSKRDANVLKGIPYSVNSNGELRARKHVTATPEVLQAMLDLAGATPTAPKTPKARPASSNLDAKVVSKSGGFTLDAEQLERMFNARELREIAKASGTKFGKSVDRRKVSDMAEALAGVWNSDIADAVATIRSTADA